MLFVYKILFFASKESRFDRLKQRDNVTEEYLELRENITVIVETDKGLQFGKVVSLNESLNGQTDLKKVIRKSTKRDYLQHLNNLKDAKDAIIKCRELDYDNNGCFLYF